jgi:general secretion pathway protein D
MSVERDLGRERTLAVVANDGATRVRIGNGRRYLAGSMAAVLLLVGFPRVSAQDQPDAPPTAEPPAPAPEPAVTPAPTEGKRTPSRPLQLGPRAAEALKRRRTPAAPKEDPTPDIVPPGATPPGPPPELPRFETGIDFKPTPPGARITFNLEDAELTDLVRLISSITGKAFILPNKSRSLKATVYAPQKVTAAEAYRAFLSILELNGLALVPSGRYLKIVESQGVESKTIPLLIDQNVPAEDRFVTHLYRVNQVSAEDVANLLGRFKSPEGNVTAYAPTNMLIITDTGTNIRRMLRIVGAIDVERGGEQLWIEPVHYANATELAQRLTEIFPADAAGTSAAPAANRRTRNTRNRTPTPSAPGAAASPGAPAETVGTRSAGFRVTNILPDERTNSLIIMATESAYLRILELIRHLDVPLDGDGGIHVHYLQHGDAEEVAKTLTTLIGGAGKRTAGAGGKGGAAAGGGGGGDAVFEGNIAVTAHAPTNSLVITSSLHDYASLKRVIDRLDSERRQVFIEAVVLNLDVGRTSNVGVGLFSGVPDFPNDGSAGVVGLQGGQTAIGGVLGGLTAAGGGGADALSGLALGIQGPTLEGGPAGLSIPSFGAVMAAIATTGDSDLLATPHLLALNNEEAEINIGQNVPLQGSVVSGLGGLGTGLLGGQGGQQGQAASAAAGLLGGLGGLGGSPPRGDVGTRIRITPHINESDEIRLEIEEEISDVGAPVAGNVGAVPINRRTAKTQLVVRDQQTVVIGGLIRDAITRSEKKVPLLGDIPLLGFLFRSTGTTKSKQNLLLFLTPYIVRTQADLRAIYERKMRERQEFVDRYFLFGKHDYRPTLEYSRTRGLVGEIMKQMGTVQADRALAAELAGAPKLEHVPRPAIGAFSGGEAPGADDTVIEGGEVTGEGGEAPPPPELPPPEAMEAPAPDSAPAPAPEQ